MSPAARLARSKPKTYGFLNLGRDKDPRTSTARIDTRILRTVREAMPDERAVVFFCEVNEGDDNNELALIRSVFKGWRVYSGTGSQNVREPIVVSPDLPLARQHTTWIPGTAVPKWSPMRSLNRVHLPDGDTLLACHRAAGAHGQGDRPEWAREPLNHSWDLTDRVQRRAQLGLHARGRHTTWMQDVNDYDLPRVGGEETVVHRATDWGRVWAAEGHRANFRALAPVNIGLDSHDFLRMRGGYPATTP